VLWRLVSSHGTDLQSALLLQPTGLLSFGVYRSCDSLQQQQHGRDETDSITLAPHRISTRRAVIS